MKMNKAESRGGTVLGWDVAFWFAVLSPALGILVGLLALFLIYR